MRTYETEISPAYEADVRRHKPLSRAQEAEATPNELVQHNLAFVLKMAEHYKHRGVPYDELVASGNVGLITASRSFKPEKGYKFITFAMWWIRREIQQTIFEQAPILHWPINVQKLARKVKAHTDKCLNRGEVPTVAELAEALNAREGSVINARLSQAGYASLDRTATDKQSGGPASKRTLKDTIPVDEPPTDEATNDLAVALALDRCLSELSPRDAQVLCERTGAFGFDECTLEQSGKNAGVCKERARQITNASIAKIKRTPRLRNLAREVLTGEPAEVAA